MYGYDQHIASSPAAESSHLPSRQQQGPPVSLSDSGHVGADASSSSSSSSSPLQRAPSSATRLNAIARLKRAASNRELKDGSPTKAVEPATTTSTTTTASTQPPSPEARAQSRADDSDGARDAQGKPSLFVQSVSPGGDAHSPMAPSPALDRGPTPGSRSLSPVTHMNLSRSASASRAESRSPLPSLEQLRSRILHERLAAGLQRSASASAASAAARAYAMNKLLGADATNREGATSPVSDSGHGRPGTIEEDDEEGGGEDVVQSDGEGDDASKRRSRRTGNQYLRPPSMRNSAHYRGLRRSRTMSNLSQRAEEERRVAFKKELDLVEEGPSTGVNVGAGDGEGGARRKKRMSRIPQRKSTASSSGEPSTPRSPATPRTRLPLLVSSPNTTEQSSGRNIVEEPLPSLQPGSTGLQRKPSQRDVARAEMMRKLSGRRLGGPSPSPVPPTESRSGHELEDDSLDSPLTPMSDAVPVAKREQISTPVPTLDNFNMSHLTPEQQMAFLQMQQLLQEQQLQLQRGAAAAVGRESMSASTEGQGSYDHLSYTFQDDELDGGETGVAEVLSSPKTPELAMREQTESTTFTADQTAAALATPISSYESSSGGTVDGSKPKTSWESPGGASAFGNNLIPSMHFTPRARGSVSAGQDWPTSPVNSMLGFGDSDDVPIGERQNGRSIDEGVSRLAVQDHTPERSVPSAPITDPRQRNGSVASQALASSGKQSSASNGLSSSLLSPAPPRQLAVPTSTPSSIHSNFSPYQDASFSRLSHATSAGGDHFVYDSLLTSSGGRNSSALGNMSFSPRSGSTAPAPTMPQQHHQQPASQPAQSQRSQKPATAPTPGDPFSQDGRIRSWRDWMTSQGMEMPDLDSPLQHRGTGGTSGDGLLSGDKTPAKQHRLDLPLLNTTGAERRPLAIDISPSLVREYGADIEWPGQLAGVQEAKTPTREAAQYAASLAAKSTSSADRSLPSTKAATPSSSPVLMRSGPSPPTQLFSSPRQEQGAQRGQSALSAPTAADPIAMRPRPPAAPERSSSIRSSSISEQQHQRRMRSTSRASEHSDAHASHSGGLRRGTDASIPEHDEAARASPAQKLVESFRARDQSSSSPPIHSRAVLSPSIAQSYQGTDTNPSTSRAPPSAWPGASTDHPADSARPLYRTMHHRVPSATDVETQTAYSNTKLTPFPGLLSKGGSVGRVTPLPTHEERGAMPATGLERLPPSGLKLARKPSTNLAQNAGAQASPSPSPTPYANHRDVSGASSLSSPVDSPSAENGSSRSLFGSLRRKASAAMRNGSLRRKPSNHITPFDVQAAPASTPASIMNSPQSATTSRLGPGQSMASIAQAAPAAVGRKPSRTLRFEDEPAESPARVQQSAPVERKPSNASQTPAPSRPDVDLRRQAVVVPGTSAADQTRESSAPSPVPYTAVRVKQVTSHSRNDSVASLESNSNGKHATLREIRTGLPPITVAAEESLDAGEATPTSGNLGSHLEPRTAAMLQRASRILTSPLKASPTSPGVPGLTAKDLESPPRQLLKVSPVFQVVSSSTIKDRFLILFDDILVVAKPLSSPSRDVDNAATPAPASTPDIRWTFVVKSIIEVRHLSITAPKDGRYQLRKHPLQDNFIAAFISNPEAALADIVRRSGLPKNAQTIAQLLVQTPGLDRESMTRLLCRPERRDVLEAWVKLQRVTGVSIESALRSTLLELRFPSTPQAFETLLLSFARHWVEENKELIKHSFTSQLAADLTFAVMALNDALHGLEDRDEEDFDEDDSIVGSEESSPRVPGYKPPGTFSEPMRSLSRSAFISALREYDPQQVLSDRTLLRIYSSVKLEPMQQALARHEEDEGAVQKAIYVSGPGLPLKLTYGVTSDPITLCIDEPDAGLSVRLYGQDLQFDPPILSFETSKQRSFTITSRSLGVRHAVFVRAGRNARLYCGTVGGPDASEGMKAAAAQGKLSDLPKSLPLTVERAFMQNAFTLTATASGVSAAERGGNASTTLPSSKRKFMFSVNDPQQRTVWVDLLTSAVRESLAKRAVLQRDLASPANGARVAKAKAKKAASTLALHVLRQALITSSTKEGAAAAGRALSPQQQGRNGSALDTRSGALGRNVSVSQRYYAAGSAGTEERELASAAGTKQHRRDGSGQGMEHSNSHEGADEARAAMTGDEIITVCQQNSLLPLVLEGSGMSNGVDSS